MSEIRFRMRPVEEKRKKEVKRSSIYDPLIDKFIESGHDLVEVEVEGRNPNSVVTYLNKRVKTRGLDIVASASGGFIYLEKKQG